MNRESLGPIFKAPEIATYVVCPEAWRLKRSKASEKDTSQRSTEAHELKKEWLDEQDLSAKLRKYAKIAYFLLVALVIVVFIWEHKRSSNIEEQSYSINSSSSNFDLNLVQAVPQEIVYLLLVLGLLIFMWDLFQRRSTSIRRDTGLSETSETISLKSSSYLPSKVLFDQELQLSSKPDALIKENGTIIPVLVKSMGKKIHDRHVIELMVNLRLLSVNQDPPPYGILLMGKERREVKIKNTEEKQRWLTTLIEEMSSILEGVPAVPRPSKFKCKSCDVRNICKHSAIKKKVNNTSQTS